MSDLTEYDKCPLDFTECPYNFVSIEIEGAVVATAKPHQEGAYKACDFFKKKYCRFTSAKNNTTAEAAQD